MSKPKQSLSTTIKAYIDLTRLHFAFVWPLLILSGLFLAFAKDNVFSWELTIKVALIGLFGFEAGLVLNDYVDRNRDKLDVEHDKMDNYWRPFKSKPLAAGLIPGRHAFVFFIILVCITIGLIVTLPYPHNLYIFCIMIYAYCVEVFYQVMKRNERFPLGQLLGRTDFTLFPVAGYLAFGAPDLTVVLYIVFFYPWTMVHLAVNDLADVKNDEAKHLKTIPTLYGVKGTVRWIMVFTMLHLIAAIVFLTSLGTIAHVGFFVPFAVLLFANYKIVTKQNSEVGLKMLPLLHMSLLLYIIIIILDVIF